MPSRRWEIGDFIGAEVAWRRGARGGFDVGHRPISAMTALISPVMHCKHLEFLVTSTSLLFMTGALAL